MTNEIKEILAYFEKYIKITDMHDSEPMLNWKDLKIVLDYITNLQEEHNSWKRVATKNFNDAEDYKSRINKAIAYINNELLPYGDEWHWDDGSIRDSVCVLLKILESKGSDNDGM